MRKPTAMPSSPESSAAGALLFAEPVHYEAALQELEKLVMQLEGGQMPLDQLLAGYQRGAQLLKYCRDKLEAVEQQIKVLEGGELKPWTQE
jgi:exodeoxyribonuclease VII small subunit